MIQKVNEVCPGDCASCEIAQNRPNFDYTFCMTYQMFRGMQEMRKDIEMLKENQSEAKNQYAISNETSDAINDNENEGL